ncbi:hypothetical protein [Nostoc favosum]|uniref:Transposase n=1 Tax=Nostoc favosum CHAB5714 TaxID=2780399 RepID=A0ABS8IJX3_9NOSO|nr:hypothetical protein [Nostoc favosum]MCC5604174.1 hypothetical protein [Nostoc favosum CHAB5714]
MPQLNRERCLYRQEYTGLKKESQATHGFDSRDSKITAKIIVENTVLIAVTILIVKFFQ